MKILSLSDIVVDRIYSPKLRSWAGDVGLIIGCGDLPIYYLEYVVSVLDVGGFFVHGNHVDRREEVQKENAWMENSPGVTNIHGKMVEYRGILLAGIEGSIRYNRGPYQYSQQDMWLRVISLVPDLLRNRILKGKALDILVTHASPWGIHDKPDLPHHGIKAFLWLIQTFQPAFHFHGHIHVYYPGEVMETSVGRTKVVNTYGFKVTEINSLSE